MKIDITQQLSFIPKAYGFGFEHVEVNDIKSLKVIHRGMTVIPINPTNELIEYAEKNRNIVEKILIRNILETDKTNIKTFLEEVIKSTDEKMYVEFLNQHFESTNAGTQTRIILKDKDYRRDETKHPNWIEVYQTGRFTPQKNKKHKRVKQHYLPEMLVSKMKLDINNALLFDKALSKISEKDELGNRYSADTAGSYNKLSDEIKNIYFEEFIYYLQIKLVNRFIFLQLRKRNFYSKFVHFQVNHFFHFLYFHYC
jgi:hypothetical protein